VVLNTQRISRAEATSASKNAIRQYRVQI